MGGDRDGPAALRNGLDAPVPRAGRLRERRRMPVDLSRVDRESHGGVAVGQHRPATSPGAIRRRGAFPNQYDRVRLHFPVVGVCDDIAVARFQHRLGTIYQPARIAVEKCP